MKDLQNKPRESIYQGEDVLYIMKKAVKYNKYLVDFLMQHIEDGDENVIDFGSGDGYFSKAISKLRQKNVINVEPAENLHAFYAEKPHVSLTEIDKNSVDVIYSLNVLEHIEDDYKTVQEFHRVLKKGGKVLLYLPAFEVLYSLFDKSVGHYRRYTLKDVKRLFGNGEMWHIEKVRYADFMGFFVSIVFKMLPNKGKLSAVSVSLYDKFVFPLSLFFDKITGGRILGKNIIIEVKKR